MKTEIFKSYAEFLGREDKSVNGVSEGFAKEKPNFESDNDTNTGCWNCSDCSSCSDCSDCSDKKEDVKAMTISKVENLNQKVSVATDDDKSLNMGDWHTCDTTHCWAGWIVHLAGKEGYELAEKTSNEFAGMMIYKESNGESISPVNFYLPNDEAKAKIDALASV